MAIATAEEVCKARGLAQFTNEQTAQAEFLLELAPSLIAEAAGKPDAWAEAHLGEDAPKILKLVAVQCVSRAMANPDSVKSFQESLGEYSSSTSFRDVAAGGGLELTERERKLVRRAVLRKLSGSSRPRGMPDEIYDIVVGEGS